MAVLRRVLANPSLRRVLSAYLLFHIAEFATWVTILLYAYERTGPASVGIVALIQLVPAALVATPAASLGDRYPRERVLAAGYLVQAIAMIATAATMAAAAPVAVVYVVAAVAASSLVVTRPTQSALLPALSRTPDELTAANGAAGIVEGLGVLLGPLMAAAILTVSTTAVVFLVAGGVLVVAALATVRLRPSGGLAALSARQPELTAGNGDADAESDDPSFLAGLRTVAADRDARLIVGLLTARTLMVGCADVLFVLMALELLGTGEPGAGVLNAALGAGTMIGGALTFALIGREGLALVAATGALVWGGAVAIIGVTATPGLATVLVIVGGAGLALVDVAGRTLLQRSVRDEVLTRVFGLQEGLAMGALALGSVLVSVLAQVFGLVPTIGAVALILPAIVALSWTRITALDRRSVVPVRAIALLRGTALFGPLPGPQLEAVARRGSWLVVPSQTALIRQGEPGDRYYVLASGAVQVERDGAVLRRLDDPGRRVRRDRPAARRAADRDGHDPDGGGPVHDRPGTVPRRGDRPSGRLRHGPAAGPGPRSGDGRGPARLSGSREKIGVLASDRAGTLRRGRPDDRSSARACHPLRTMTCGLANVMLPRSSDIDTGGSHPDASFPSSRGPRGRPHHAGRGRCRLRHARWWWRWSHRQVLAVERLDDDGARLAERRPEPVELHHRVQERRHVRGQGRLQPGQRQLHDVGQRPDDRAGPVHARGVPR